MKNCSTRSSYLSGMLLKPNFTFYFQSHRKLMTSSIRLTIDDSSSCNTGALLFSKKCANIYSLWLSLQNTTKNMTADNQTKYLCGAILLLVSECDRKQLAAFIQLEHLIPPSLQRSVWCSMSRKIEKFSKK